MGNSFSTNVPQKESDRPTEYDYFEKILNLPREKSGLDYPVEVLFGEIDVYGGVGLGRILASFMSNHNDLPNIGSPRVEDLAKHGALMVHGRIYEYNEDGLKSHDANEEALSRFPEQFLVGYTLKTETEFQDWLKRVWKRFTLFTYNAGYNNCHHFVKTACKFLQVTLPEDKKKVTDWLKEGGAVFMNQLAQLSKSLRNLQSPGNKPNSEYGKSPKSGKDNSIK